MIPAYDETYLPDAMANLAGAFDYALNDCGLPVGLFMDFFATSEAAALFGRGTPKYVCGMSGEELVAEIMRQTGWRAFSICRQPHCAPAQHPNTGPDGYSHTANGPGECGSRTFSMCCRSTISCDAPRLCTKPTKADSSTCTTSGPPIIAPRATPGCTRSACAPDSANPGWPARSGVTLRSIQMYEQRRKDLGKAAVSTVLALARTLGCRIEDLLEP